MNWELTSSTWAEPRRGSFSGTENNCGDGVLLTVSLIGSQRQPHASETITITVHAWTSMHNCLTGGLVGGVDASGYVAATGGVLGASTGEAKQRTKDAIDLMTMAMVILRQAPMLRINFIHLSSMFLF